VLNTSGWQTLNKQIKRADMSLRYINRLLFVMYMSCVGARL